MVVALRRAWHWMRALKWSREGNVERALADLTYIETFTALQPYEVAFKATLLLRQRRMAEAKAALILAVEMVESKDSGNARYVYLFATALLHGMHGDLKDERKFLDLARKVSCSGTLKRWLPLYDAELNSSSATMAKTESPSQGPDR
jgi:hypothetical protein